MVNTEGDWTLDQRVVAAHVVKDWVMGEYTRLRAQELADLNAGNKEASRPITSTTVSFPGIGDTAKITLPKEDGKWVVDDPAAFAASVEDWHPGAVEVIVQVKPAEQKAILKKLHEVPDDDGNPHTVHINKDGEPNPVRGVKWVEARKTGEASKFSMTFPKPADPHEPAARDVLLEQILSGGLSRLLGEQLPAITDGEDAVVDAEIVEDQA